ncbi:hypothetical protein A2774_02800 [Candidatus Roizmanbacteria bacterium RIFCSPHIGHO2_01_FULL_39_12c]|uniref:Ribosome recycling factor domain-containing protein n=1 Tax=Candidatus Roizmanbacteria bacterium RIFCSPHIGHO2_01_FULL_39_12c TaxID=1802031 RepID=A0A1F7GBP6_9BACT|nr:MAG: hypothetical protein A2774_02800 [Candidatus Roizmanbacteria bacterium RIFCSPHIGHO2_01_FULL_39_12c]OGK47482.1 MAG: hypothetical protein A2963_01150 [Candidatus Roizmanbacteria bacterium RIFCSPLOWO2_01_FULL_40_13]
MNPIINQFKQQSEKALSYLKEDLKTIRTGKANPALLENLQVEAYDGQSKLKLTELATIMTDGPSALSVTPFDSSILPDIEKAILKSAFGISPAIQGNRIIARIPPLSQEQREKFVKLISQKIEERKNTFRGFRDEARKKIKLSLDNKEITEDQKYKIEKEVEIISREIMDKLQTLKQTKEKEIMEI